MIILISILVGVIYCFCFFNLKEGKSRYRATIFYTIIIGENLAFLAVFYWTKSVYDGDKYNTFSYWLVTAAFALEIGSMIIGLTSMLLYYR